jgi:hypothetical protein
VRGPRPPSRPLPQPACLSNGGSPRGVRQRCEVGKDRLVRWLEAEHQTASGLGSSPQSTPLKVPPEPGEFRRYQWAGHRPSTRGNERSGGGEEQQPHRPSRQRSKQINASSPLHAEAAPDTGRGAQRRGAEAGDVGPTSRIDVRRRRSPRAPRCGRARRQKTGAFAWTRAHDFASASGGTLGLDDQLSQPPHSTQASASERPAGNLRAAPVQGCVGSVGNENAPRCRTEAHRGRGMAIRMGKDHAFERQPAPRSSFSAIAADPTTCRAVSPSANQRRCNTR